MQIYQAVNNCWSAFSSFISFICVERLMAFGKLPTFDLPCIILYRSGGTILFLFLFFFLAFDPMRYEMKARINNFRELNYANCTVYFSLFGNKLLGSFPWKLCTLKCYAIRLSDVRKTMQKTMKQPKHFIIVNVVSEAAAIKQCIPIYFSLIGY